ncbi:hypothetical protein L1887_55621 [Cichorium endivia]|nr:hypothetical protein L1887_55621 [Cichorium endivia]
MVRGCAHWWLRGAATRRRRRLSGASPRAPGTLHQHASRMGNLAKKKEKKWGGARLHATYNLAVGLLASTLRTFLPATVGRIASECARSKVDKSYARNARAGRCALRDGSHQTAWHYANSRRGERVGRQVSGGLHRLCLARTMRSPCTSPHPIIAAVAAAAAAAAGSAFLQFGQARAQRRQVRQPVPTFPGKEGARGQILRPEVPPSDRKRSPQHADGRDAPYDTSWDAP